MRADGWAEPEPDHNRPDPKGDTPCAPTAGTNPPPPPTTRARPRKEHANARRRLELTPTQTDQPATRKEHAMRADGWD